LPDARRSVIRAEMVGLSIKPENEKAEAKTKTPADLARDFYQNFSAVP
jgi:hypothetical protein